MIVVAISCDKLTLISGSLNSFRVVWKLDVINL